MGLDNIPEQMPCRKAATAVFTPDLNDGVVDCSLTKEAGGCPWQSCADRPEDGQVLGLLGADCWYRGKWGNILINQLESRDDELYFVDTAFDFYGDNADQSSKSPESCLATADYMEELLSKSINRDETFQNEVRYAVWWLRWVANNWGGAHCWF